MCVLFFRRNAQDAVVKKTVFKSYLSHTLSDKAIKGIVVNRTIALQSLQNHLKLCLQSLKTVVSNLDVRTVVLH